MPPKKRKLCKSPPLSSDNALAANEEVIEILLSSSSSSKSDENDSAYDDDLENECDTTASIMKKDKKGYGKNSRKIPTKSSVNVRNNDNRKKKVGGIQIKTIRINEYLVITRIDGNDNGDVYGIH